jgi:predicted O-methyltransferase YrrM
MPQENGLYLYEFHQYLRPNIERIMSLPNMKVDTVIEIGVFQGYFTFNMTGMMAQNNPNYRHFAIDSFSTAEDLDSETISDAEKCFLKNLKNFQYSKNIIPIKDKSVDALVGLIYENYKADLIYIDGAHTADVVLQDITLSWNLLNKGGVILCDDSSGSWMYKDKNGFKPVQKSPRLAVENFIQCYWDQIEIIDLPNNWQTAFRRIN